MPTTKKINKLRQVVREMADQYGVEDAHVQRLQSDLLALEGTAPVTREERRKVQIARYTFGSLARQNYRDQHPR
jgi:hypothetical protein